MTEPEIHIRWPASRFYWAVLDGSALPRGLGRPTRQLGFLLEPHIPVPIEEVHSVFARVSGTRYLACAIPSDVLTSDVSESAITLTPEALPEFVPDEVDPTKLNLLTGTFTPKAIARLRVRWVVQSVAFLLIATGIVVFGFERRTATVNARHAEIATSGAVVVAQRLGYGANASRLPLDLRLQAELRSLRQTRTAPIASASNASAAVTLAQLLALWPATLLVETDSIQVAPDSVNVRATLATNDDAQTLATALSRLPGFALAIPSMHAASDATRAELAWTREKGGGR